MKTQSIVLVYFVAALLALASANWPNSGGGLGNQRNAKSEEDICPESVGSLTPKWIAQVAGDISATPVTRGNRVYVTDFGGKITAFDRDTGVIAWQADVTLLFPSPAPGIPAAVSRTAPAVVGNRLIFGTLGIGACWIFALDARNGLLLWKTQVETHPWAQITQSPTVWGDSVFVGTSSNEEAVQRFVDPNYPCCSFQGSFLALRVSNGQIMWRTRMMPNNNGATTGYSGNAIWGSAPSINPGKKHVYFATGNNYDVPASVKTCLNAAGNNYTLAATCYDPNNHFDSVLALDTDSGAIRWATRLEKSDVWTLICGIGSIGLPPTPDCPTFGGPDYDFAQAPMLIKNVRVASAGNKRIDLLVVGQKSGMLWALQATDGKIKWSRRICPGGDAGGVMWGSATDEKRAYIACTNSERANFSYVNPHGNTVWTTGGVFSAVDLYDGSFVWTVPDPNGSPLGPLSVANGVVFGSSLSGFYYALDAHTGTTLWTYNLGTSANAGFAIDDGVVYVGSGYSRNAPVGDNRVFAFSVPH